MTYGRSHTRPDRSRRFAALLVMLLLLVGGAPQDGYGLRPCPHHDGAGETTGGQHPVGHGSHADPPHETGCTCIGACHAGGHAPLVPLPGGALLRTAAKPPADPARVEVERLAGSAPFTLPYSTAPPTLG